MSEQKPEPGPRDPGSIELVSVWTAQGEMEAQVIRAALESEGIDCMLTGESLRLALGLTVDGIGEVRIMVRTEDEERAREIIAAFQAEEDEGATGSE
jgi:hypothetical protein